MRPERAYNWICRPGDRGRVRALEESPDTAGQDAPEALRDGEGGGEIRRKVAQKGNRLRRKLSGDAGGKGETVG